MIESQRFSFQKQNSLDQESAYFPYLPLILTHQNTSLEVMGLLDTGASVNVLPYQIGRQLGLNWGQQLTQITLTGNLANFESKGVIVKATINPFSSVRLAFAWTQANNIPLILGQINFFLEFDVCFYRSQLIFEIRPKIKNEK